MLELIKKKHAKTVLGGQRKGINGRQGICMERSRALLTSVYSDTQRWQNSAHSHNEDRVLVVKTHLGRKNDMERGKESRGWLLISKER